MKKWMTRKTYDRLSKEIDTLEKVEIPQTSKAKLLASQEGDLGENAEYIACKEKLELLAIRLEQLRHRIIGASYIDDLKIPGQIVSIGTKVSIEYTDENKTITYSLLGTEDIDIDNGIISISSPLGKGLVGKKIGDAVNIETPEGCKPIKILDIKLVFQNE